MTNTPMINNIKNVIINNLAINENILGEVIAYNDVTQTNTFMAFTTNRVFFWHDSISSSKLKTKSYNLVKAVVVSRGVFAIHFNDEIVKFLVNEDSAEYDVMNKILSSYVNIDRPEPKNQNRDMSSNGPKNKDKKSHSLLKPLFIVLTVILISFLGTMGFIYGREWFAGLNNNSGMTAEKLKEIKASIALGEKRIFELQEYQQTLNNYSAKIDLIYVDVKAISPSDILFDWDSARNTFSNHLLSVKALTPKSFDDKGPYFDIKSGVINTNTQQTYLSLKTLVDDSISGIDNHFATISDLVRIKQSLMALKDKIAELNSAADAEIVKVQADIDTNKALIQQ